VLQKSGPFIVSDELFAFQPGRFHPDERGADTKEIDRWTPEPVSS
jgi:hypothetical protein